MCLAVPGKLISVSGADLNRTGRVSFSGVVKEVSLAYVPEAQIGDYVIVHVGFALSVVDEVEAQRFERQAETPACRDRREQVLDLEADEPALRERQLGEARESALEPSVGGLIT